jgi:hypothetical protein
VAFYRALGSFTSNDFVGRPIESNFARALAASLMVAGGLFYLAALGSLGRSCKVCEEARGTGTTWFAATATSVGRSAEHCTPHEDGERALLARRDRDGVSSLSAVGGKALEPTGEPVAIGSPCKFARQLDLLVVKRLEQIEHWPVFIFQQASCDVHAVICGDSNEILIEGAVMN